VFEPIVFRNLLGYIERGEIRPVVAKIYALGSIVAAQRDFSAKKHTGKIVLQP
jgi:NADPH:quinone reductase-like Zn-dependent oxidoreductase